MQSQFIPTNWPWYKRPFAFAMEDPITIGSQWAYKDDYDDPFSGWTETNVRIAVDVQDGWVQFQEGWQTKSWRISLFRYAHRRVK